MAGDMVAESVSSAVDQAEVIKNYMLGERTGIELSGAWIVDKNAVVRRCTLE